MFAIFLALFGSFWFAAAMTLINRGVLSIDYFRGLLANLGINTVFLWLYVLLFIDSIDLWLPVNSIFVAVGIFVPGVARFFIFKGMERLGATISSCLTNAGPLFAIVIAISFLGEQPTASNILGAISIVGGIIALSWKGVAKTWRTRDLGFPLTAALLFAAAIISCVLPWSRSPLRLSAPPSRQPRHSSPWAPCIWYSGRRNRCRHPPRLV